VDDAVAAPPVTALAVHGLRGRIKCS